MKVTIISSTPDALDLLLRTKNTRLANTDDDPATWTLEKKQEHLDYMRDTIKSSWEFVDYVFEIEGVTRAFTHQLVRNRMGSYAQESQRTIDASGNGWMNPLSLTDDSDFENLFSTQHEFDIACASSFSAYTQLLKRGIPPQDARGVLPTATLTSIVAKYNLRTLSEMAKLRLCTRTQGEFNDVFRLMREAVIEQHAWAEPFLEVHCVATGTCAFPRYGKKDCPVYLPTMDNTNVREEARTKFWTIRFEAKPVAIGGKAS